MPKSLTQFSDHLKQEINIVLYLFCQGPRIFGSTLDFNNTKQERVSNIGLKSPGRSLIYPCVSRWITLLRVFMAKNQIGLTIGRKIMDYR